MPVLNITGTGWLMRTVFLSHWLQLVMWCICAKCSAVCC